MMTRIIGYVLVLLLLAVFGYLSMDNDNSSRPSESTPQYHNPADNAFKDLKIN